ncbi:hypothetical protein ASPFODRAFT_700684 [Aspergillus luchuensis CBS 106.47]|uniref:FAD-binding domain-containing protein n=1 Tax=Aspergillus luchuensis (strain CBS 106.47) TaxID=1137211 RepID=A0A1M3T842_ASPLC|nr:hypothetical protein ASPFODRAFT_700684 [Aspergillus luchuensis CBS 106.47]
MTPHHKLIPTSTNTLPTYTSNLKNNNQPTMKIIIIGAGISGCAAYLTLRKHLPPPPPSSPSQDHEFTIYEAYPSPSSPNPPNPTNKITVGGGLGIAPNGLRVLERLDESILRDAVTSGYMLDHTNLKDKHGKTLIQLPSSSSSNSGSNESSGSNKALHLLGTSRHNFWLCLHRRIPENVIVYNKRVARVISHPTQRNTVTFVDGSEPVYADLVIGADGLRSVVRQQSILDGLIGIGGFLPTHTIGGIEPGSLNLHFSGTGFFGYFYATSSSTSPTRSSAYHVSEPGDTLVWWTTYSTPTPPDGRDVDVDDVKSQLKSRFSTWTDPLVLHIINSVEVQTMWPTFTTPELPTWEREGVVLVGDAAHALPSTSGQGASQALEDVEALARLLGHEVGVWYQEQVLGGMSGGSGGGVEGEKRAIQMACKRYVEMRMPRVKRILDTARGMQNSKRDMGGWGEWVMYWVMWVMGFFPGLVARQQQEVFDYDLPAEVERVLDRGL